MKQYRPILFYLARFLGLFALLFYGTEAIIGLSSPGNHYNAFVAAHLNFINPFRYLLLSLTGKLLALFGLPTYFKDPYTLSMAGGRGVRMIYSCLGYGVLSFWIAFVFANRGSWKRKAVWMIGGALLLCGLNIVRLGLVLVAANRGWQFPFGWDHHTWFNILAYLLIFVLIWRYDRSGRRGRHPGKAGQAALPQNRQSSSAGTPVSSLP